MEVKSLCSFALAFTPFARFPYCFFYSFYDYCWVVSADTLRIGTAVAICLLAALTYCRLDLVVASALIWPHGVYVIWDHHI